MGLPFVVWLLNVQKLPSESHVQPDVANDVATVSRDNVFALIDVVNEAVTSNLWRGDLLSGAVL